MGTEIISYSVQRKEKYEIESLEFEMENKMFFF